MTVTKTVFIRTLEELHDKERALLSAIRDEDAARKDRWFLVKVNGFAVVPGTPFAYWVSDDLRSLFLTKPSLESGPRVARRGVNSNDDQRFLRLTWETLGRDWALHVKGGVWSPYYADPHMYLKWGEDGRELLAERVTSRVYKSAIVPSRELYFRPGLTWARRTKSELSIRIMPSACIFGDKGPAIICEDDGQTELLALLAVSNSRSFRALVEFQLAAADAKPGGAAHSYEVGVIQRTPVPLMSEVSRNALAELSRTAWRLRRSLDTHTETSHAFTLPALLQITGPDIASRATRWSEQVRTTEAELASTQFEIDERCFELYGIGEADRRSITDGFGSTSPLAEERGELDEPTEEDATEDDSEAGIDATVLAAELVSWTIGVAFGRFDVRLATGTRPLPADPEPFAPLPVCSPGMLTGNDGLPLTRAPADYPISFPEGGVLVDDPGHIQDLMAAVRTVFEVVFGADADRWWNDVAAALDPKDHDVRTWLAGGFFDHHLKRHSKSRRKAPIFWQISTPSRRYSIWLYAHRLTRDSFFQLQSDIVGPKLMHEEQRLRALIQSLGKNPSASERKKISSQEALIEELRAMFEEIKRVAPLWNPDLDDGVVLTMAPLWRLVPQHKAWQTELRSKWKELVDGKYDWAHIAMRLWPERVIPKCVTDRSLAIAHGLEDNLWMEDEDGIWQPRESPLISTGELVRERSSSAVRAALKNLLEARARPGTGRRTDTRSAS